MHFLRRLSGWINGSKAASGPAYESSFSGDEARRRAARRRRRQAESGDSFFVRQLEERRVLSADVVLGQQFIVAENATAGTPVGTVQTTPPADPTVPLTFSI